MKFSHIKPRSIYIVDFDPVRQCEFNGRHLALVLKRNNDKNTFIVMPLTSSPNGENINKINIGNIDTLPPSLRNNITYAVFNQIRTVKADRFIALKDGNKRVNSYVDENTGTIENFCKILICGSGLRSSYNYDALFSQLKYGDLIKSRYESYKVGATGGNGVCNYRHLYAIYYEDITKSKGFLKNSYGY